MGAVACLAKIMHFTAKEDILREFEDKSNTYRLK